MSKENINVLDRIQEILDREKKPFTTVKNLASKLGTECKKELGISERASSAEIVKAIKNFSEDKFIFSKKGKSSYILKPCNPEDLIMSELSYTEGKSHKVVAKIMPFSQSKCIEILNELLYKGKIKSYFSDNFDIKIYLTPPEEEKQYTVEEFREAFDANKKGRIFVRICDIRNTLNWPREVFDNMLKDLRDKRIITLHTLEIAGMTEKNVEDSFIDENNFRMGTVTWNVR